MKTNKMKIFVTHGGVKTSIEVELSDTIESVRAKALAKTASPKWDSFLYSVLYHDRKLESWQTLAFYGVEKYDTINIIRSEYYMQEVTLVSVL